MYTFYCGAGRDKGSWMKIVEFQFQADGPVGAYLADVLKTSEGGARGIPPAEAIQAVDAALARRVADPDGADIEEKQAMLEGLVLARKSIVATAKAGYEDFATNYV